MEEHRPSASKANWFFWLALFGMVSPVATFMIAISEIAPGTKIALLSLIATSYAGVFLLAYFRGRTDGHGNAPIIPRSQEIDADTPAAELAEVITDPITLLPNKNAFFLVLQYQIAESSRDREERPLSVLAIDIKRFAEFNKEFGEEAGDRVLCSAADIIRQQLRSMDFLARIDGDEFAVVIPKADEQRSLEVIKRIEAGFREYTSTIESEITWRIEINFGSATYWRDGDTPEQLLRHAQVMKQLSKAELPAKDTPDPDKYVH